MTGTLAVVAALRAEIAPLLAAIEDLTPVRGDGRRWVRGRLGQQRVIVVATGDGAAAARRGIAALLSQERPERLLVVGVAGGLSRGLECGDLVVATRLLPSTAGVTPDPVSTARLLALSGVAGGTVITVPEIALDPAAKAAILERHGAPAAAVVDLESMVFGEQAARYGVPFAVLRAVLDPAQETLPLDFNRCLARDGQVSSARVAAQAASHPGVVLALWGLRRRLGACAHRLAAVTLALVEAEASPAGMEPERRRGGVRS